MLVFCVFLPWVVASRCAEPPAPVTVTPFGVIRGSWMTTRKGQLIEAYRNIPYAKPPVDELRFEPPVPINKYYHEVDATKDGPQCPQPVTPDSPGEMDEDCLKLNVYTPKIRNSLNLLPVVVFINYGAFYLLSGRSDVVGPRYLLDYDVILVTFNFRLGSFGFLSTGDKVAPGNNGFKDQVIVLRWVKKNIAAFGGDPGSVTLVGCGSGSYSANLHMLSPMSKGLFHRVVAMSGSPFSQVKIGHDQSELAEKQARLVGCPTNNSSAIIKCLKSKPWKEISDSVNSIIELGLDRTLYWTVVVENDFGQEVFMPYEPLDAVRSGKLYSVPYIVSQTRDEYSWLANVILNNATVLRLLNEEYAKYAPLAFQLPKGSEKEAQKLRKQYFDGNQIGNDTKSAEKLAKLFADSVIGFSVHRVANLMCRNSKAAVYYLQFDYIGKNSFYQDPRPNKLTGVAHHDDLIYIFSMPGVFPDIGLTGSDAEMVDKMTAIIYNFAKYGDPNSRDSSSNLPTWPRMVASNRSYLRLSSDFSVRQNLNENRYSTWDSLFSIIYTPKSQTDECPPVPVHSGIIGTVLNTAGKLVTGLLG